MMEKSTPSKRIFLCNKGNCAPRSEIEAIYERIENLVEEHRAEHPEAEIKVKLSGCLDICECGPVMVVQPDQVWYQKLNVEAVEEIFRQHLTGSGEVVEKYAAQPEKLK